MNMSNSEFMKSSPRIEQAVIEATTGPNASFENLRESMKSELANQGLIARERTDLYGATVIPQPMQPSASNLPLDASGQVREDHRRERVIYPHGNARVVLTGLSESELDEMERRVRASFGQ
jgi:hypothetical protein